MNKRGLVGAFGALALGLVGAVIGVGTAQATEPPAVESLCNTGWYVNPDETQRMPTQVEAGLEFEGSDLVHRATSLPLADLKPGEFVAVPAPDQPSFFSVEVRNSAGAYGTLRWDGAQWMVVIGNTANGKTLDGTLDVTPGAFTDANPVTLLAGKVTKWGAFDAAPVKAVSFGVGYTANPPGTVKTVVKSVTFNGVKYLLDCPKKPKDWVTHDWKFTCDKGAFVRKGTVTFSWDGDKRRWVKQPVVWTEWKWVRPLTDKEREQKKCDVVTTPPTTPPVTAPPATTPPTTPPATTEPPVPAGNVGGDDGGSLAKTGTPTLLIAGGGLALLFTGAALLVVTQRRRRVLNETLTETAVMPRVQ